MLEEELETLKHVRESVINVMTNYNISYQKVAEYLGKKREGVWESLHNPNITLSNLIEIAEAVSSLCVKV